MSEQDSVVVKGRTFEPPGKGPWELESTHSSRPVTRIGQAAFMEGFPRGFAEGTAKYGVLLDHLKPGFVHSFLYNQPVAVGAPPGVMGPPPKPILQVVSRIHPKMRQRHRAAAAAIEEKIWRRDLEEWDQVDKPAAIKAHQAIQAVDVASLTDSGLVDHVDHCAQHVIDNAYLHHKYTMTACVPVGDFLASAIAWTGADVGELMGLLRGRSVVSRGFAAAELDAAAKALTTSESAQGVLAGSGAATDILTSLCEHPEVGAEVTAYVGAVRWRSVGYDIGDQVPASCPRCWSSPCAPPWRGAGPRLRTTTPP